MAHTRTDDPNPDPQNPTDIAISGPAADQEDGLGLDHDED